MQCRLTRIDPVSAAKSLAGCYALLGLLGGFIQFAMRTSRPGGVADPGVVLLPTLDCAAAGFLATLLIALAYNVSASWSGGIEVRLDHPEAPKSPGPDS